MSEIDVKKVNLPIMPLTQLPNGDLWRGYNPELTSSDNLDLDSADATIQDDIMATVILSSKTQHSLTCPWCGHQEDKKLGYEAMRSHVLAQHKKTITGVSDAAALATMIPMPNAKGTKE